MNDTVDRRQYRQHRRPTEFLRTVRNILNIVFMIVAIVGVTYYFVADKQTGTYIILGAMVFKIAESAIRLLRL